MTLQLPNRIYQFELNLTPPTSTGTLVPALPLDGHCVSSPLTLNSSFLLNDLKLVHLFNGTERNFHILPYPEDYITHVVLQYQRMVNYI